MAENYYSLLGEGFARAGQLRRKDEKKQMKKAMKYQLLYGLGGKFLGDLISTPFKEPVKRFFNTEAGRQIKAKQTYALSDLDRLENIDSDITKSGGEGGPVQGLFNVYMGHVDDRMSSPDMFGPKWEEGPNAHKASAWRASLEPRLREKAEREVAELRDRIQELSLTPSDNRLLELGTGARILAPSPGVKAGRWIQELLGGKTQADRDRDGMTYILTGDSPDLKGSAWANAGTQGFINKSNKAAELYNPNFIRDTFDEMKEGMMYKDGELVYDEELHSAWNILSETQKAQTANMASQANVASQLTTSPARLLNISGYDEVKNSLVQKLGRMPNTEEMDEAMTVQSKGLDMNNVVVNNLISQLKSRSEMVEIVDNLRDDLTYLTASEFRRPGVNIKYHDAPDWQQAIVDQRIDSAYRSWLQLSSSTYHSARLKAIKDKNLDATFVGEDAEVNIQEALLYGVQRIGEDYLAITNHDQRNTILTRLLEKLGAPIQDQLRTGSVNQFARNIFGEEMVEYVGLPSETRGSDQEKLQERVRERLEKRRAGKDGDNNSNSLVDHLYRDDGTTPAQREGPRSDRVHTIPTDHPDTVGYLAQIRTHWQNGEAAEAMRYTDELINKVEGDNPGETWRMPAEFYELELAFKDPEGTARATEQEEAEVFRARFRDQARDPVEWGRDLPKFPPEGSFLQGVIDLTEDLRRRPPPEGSGLQEGISRIGEDISSVPSLLSRSDPVVSEPFGPLTSNYLETQFKRLEDSEYSVQDKDTYVSNVEDFRSAVKSIESASGKRPTSKTSSARGDYHVLEGSVKTQKQRLRNAGVSDEIVDAISDDPLDWTSDQSDLMFFGNLFQQKPIDPKLADKLSFSSGLGTDALLHEVGMNRNVEAAMDLYFTYHMNLTKDPNKRQRANAGKLYDLFGRKSFPTQASFSPTY